MPRLSRRLVLQAACVAPWLGLAGTATAAQPATSLWKLEPCRRQFSSPAQAAAGEIHTDLSRGFIRAEVVAYDRLIARGAMAACKEHGELRLEGKEYVVQDGDIINVRFAT